MPFPAVESAAEKTISEMVRIRARRLLVPKHHPVLFERRLHSLLRNSLRDVCRRLKPARRSRNKGLRRWPGGQLYPNGSSHRSSWANLFSPRHPCPMCRRLKPPRVRNRGIIGTT